MKKLFTLFALGLSLALLLNMRSSVANESLKAVGGCLPQASSEQPPKFTLVMVANSPRTDPFKYLLVRVEDMSGNNPWPWHTVVGLKRNQRCIGFLKEQASEMPLERWMPKPIALRFKQAIDQEMALSASAFEANFRKKYPNKTEEELIRMGLYDGDY